VAIRFTEKHNFWLEMIDAVLIPSAEALSALRGDPRCPGAMRHAARSSVELYRGDRLLNALMSDRARALFTHVALYLHYGGPRSGQPGLTVGAMKDLCAELGLCSRGRCEAMLTLMRAAGLFVAVPSPDRRRRPLAPTEKLFALHRERWGAHFAAMREVLPKAASYHAAIADPAFVEAFVVALGRRFVAGLRILDQAPGLELFAERNAGMMILFSLALAGPERGPFPPADPVPLSFSALARKFSVSRKHVLTLLRDAEAQGLFMRGGAAGNEVTLLPACRDAFEMLFVTMFLYLAQCAEEALATMAAATASPVRFA
jgi:hypothetical protein